MSGHIRQQRVPIPVGEVARVVELPERGQAVFGRVLDGSPHPHRRRRVDRTQRHILGHALDEPQGQGGGGRETAELAERPSGDVVLEGVGQLVADHVIEVAEGAANGKHDPPPKRLGDTAGSLAEVAADGVGLLEFGRSWRTESAAAARRARG